MKERTNLEILDAAQVQGFVFRDDDLNPVALLLKRAAESSHHISQTPHLMSAHRFVTSSDNFTLLQHKISIFLSKS